MIREGPLSFADLGMRKETGEKPLLVPEEEVSYKPCPNVTSNHIQRVLKITKGKVECKIGAAKLLGINPGTLSIVCENLEFRLGGIIDPHFSPEICYS